LLSTLIKLFFKLSRTSETLRGARSFVENYPVDDIASKARRGKEAVFPFSEKTEFGKALLGADIYEKGFLRYDTLSQILLVPPLFTPLRLKKMQELLREPLFSDVATGVYVGGFQTSMPLCIASMGSTDVWNKVAVTAAREAAKLGVAMGVGENVATIWGYAKRKRSSQPSFKERVMAYLENIEGTQGGVFIQQSVEDAYDELWNKVYSDPDITPFIHKGQVAFEVKLGQGAKPGIGGETFVTRETALEIRDKYSFDDDPATVERKRYARHSAPGTFTEQILRSMLRSLKNNYPRCRIWVKAGPYRDIGEVATVLAEEEVEALWIDSKEGGTGMSPVIALQDLGLPILACLDSVRRLRSRGLKLDTAISGRLANGGDVVKCLCLGAKCAGMGRPLVVAAYAAGGEGVRRFLEATRMEIQLLISALGKYSVEQLGEEDVRATTRELAASLGIRSIYD